jgi:hypothetical protein
MNASGERWRQLNRASGKTATAVEQQIAAMGSELLEVGLYDPDAGGGESVMIPRVWDSGTIAKSVPWLRHQNRKGRNIYIRPKGEHDLSMVDDLTADAISAMKQTGFNPAVIVETSPDNFQAWLKHNGRLSKEVSTAAARALAEKFGGDRGAADWRHFGRLAGFTNRKAKHLDASTGLYPYVRLIEATAGNSATRAQCARRRRRTLTGSARMVATAETVRESISLTLCTLYHTEPIPSRWRTQSGRAICRIRETNGARMITWRGPSKRRWARSSAGVNALGRTLAQASRADVARAGSSRVVSVLAGRRPHVRSSTGKRA